MFIKTTSLYLLFFLFIFPINALLVSTDAQDVEKRKEKSRQWIQEECLKYGVPIDDIDLSTDLLMGSLNGNAAIKTDFFTSKNSLILGYGYGLTPFSQEVMLPEDQRKFLIAHECGHRVNRDHEKNVLYTAVQTVMPVLAHKKMRSFGKTPLAAAATAAGLFFSSLVYYPQFRKKAELRADLTTRDPKLLEAGARLFERWHEKELQNNNQQKTLLERFKNYFTEFHPDHLSRATRVRVEAEKIRLENSPT